MRYTIELTPFAEKEFAALDKIAAQHIAHRIDWLAQNAETVIHTPLKGQFKGMYRLRSGDWRAVYSIDHQAYLITIFSIRHRSQVYKF